MRAHQRLCQIAVTPEQRLIDLDMFGMRAPAALRIVEIDRQPPLAHDVVDAADTVEHAVLSGAHDLEMEITVLAGQVLTRGEPFFRLLEDLAQPFIIFFRGARAGELRRLDFVDLSQFHCFVDLDRIKRQAGPRKQRHRLHACLAGVDIYARLGATLHDTHRLQDRQRLAYLPATDAKMLCEFPFGRRAPGGAVAIGKEVGGQFRKQRVFFHCQQRCTCASRNFSEIVKPRPGFSGIAIIPSFTSTVSSTRLWIIGLAPSEYSTMKEAGAAAQTCSPAKKQGAPAHKCGAKRRLKALATVLIRIASEIPPQKAGSGCNMSAALITARSRDRKSVV